MSDRLTPFNPGHARKHDKQKQQSQKTTEYHLTRRRRDLQIRTTRREHHAEHEQHQHCGQARERGGGTKRTLQPFPLAGRIQFGDGGLHGKIHHEQGQGHGVHEFQRRAEPGYVLG